MCLLVMFNKMGVLCWTVLWLLWRTGLERVVRVPVDRAFRKFLSSWLIRVSRHLVAVVKWEGVEICLEIPKSLNSHSFCDWVRKTGNYLKMLLTHHAFVVGWSIVTQKTRNLRFWQGKSYANFWHAEFELFLKEIIKSYFQKKKNNK